MFEQLVFVIIEGLDGSGKSTQAKRLYDYLRKQGKTVCLRFHPSNDNFFGVKARQCLLSRGKSTHFGASLFYMLDVFRSIIIYSWQKYDYVVFIRYLMGTAYLPSPFHAIMYRFFASIVPKSDLIFFLDVDPEEAYRRLQQARIEHEMFEDLRELERIRSKSLTLASMGKWKVIDANKSPGNAEKEMTNTIMETVGS